MPLLEISNACVRFGGLQALADFSFTLDPGELVALIGPNGAGKTTAFNIATGVYAPASGTIELGGKRIDGSKPAQINHAGIARTFQNIRLFSRMTVLDNVMVGFNRSAERGLLGTFLRSPRFLRQRRLFHTRALELLGTMHLNHLATQQAGGLSYGDQRRLEIARALATEPKILLLDEPAAGMNPLEKVELMQLIRFIRDRFGIGIWLIEHDMTLVMAVCQRITVLDHGETIAIGTPMEVRSNPKVIEAYLGEPLGAAI
jgi:branched-chain amino acid transport system ATP-binding protein